MSPRIDWKPLAVYDPAVFRHINDLVACKCFPDLLTRDLFPNAKELTESMSVYHYARYHLRELYPLKDLGVTLVSVGDGCTPRTAALFAFRSAWQCISIDPRLRDKDWDTQRLLASRCRVEEVNLKFHRVVIVAVHSHASLAATLDHVRGYRRALIALPCCVKVDIRTPPTVRKRDLGVWSPRNELWAWHDI